MNKWSKEEVSLCKQVAKRHRKPIRRGDWWIGANEKPILAFGDVSIKMNKHLTPLWTISDCLEFLKGRNYDCILYSNQSQLRWYLKFNIYPLVSSMEILNGGKTPLEVCLKAVLAVLEEEG